MSSSTHDQPTERDWGAAKRWFATRDDELVDGIPAREWLATRREAGQLIKSASAETCWSYAQTSDPYGIYSEPPDEIWQVGREYFARAPGTDIWVHFDDLPEITRAALSLRCDSDPWPFDTVPF